MVKVGAVFSGGEYSKRRNAATAGTGGSVGNAMSNEVKLKPASGKQGKMSPSRKTESKWTDRITATSAVVTLIATALAAFASGLVIYHFFFTPRAN